ncbi:hypothetical protein BJV82DRAFT_664520 [Fennellomyces sp. T-0311]|nr:hypothetical protein BJV82DRAFT_664520 [Fennellomyces sp. T-0311]
MPRPKKNASINEHNVSSMQLPTASVANREEPSPSTYFSWTVSSLQILLEVLGDNAGRLYWAYQGGQKNGGKSKKMVCNDIAAVMRAKGVDINGSQVSSKVKALEQAYIKVKDFIRATGEGIDSDDDNGNKAVPATTNDKIKEIMSCYEEYNKFAYKGAKSNPPYRTSTDNNDLDEEAAQILLDAPASEPTTDAEQDIEQRVASTVARIHGHTIDGHDDQSAVEVVADNPDQTTVDGSIARRSSKKRKATPTTVAESLVRLGEMRMEIQKEKMEMEREKMRQRAETESAKMQLLRDQIHARMQESQERSLMLQIELEKLKQKKGRDE